MSQLAELRAEANHFRDMAAAHAAFEEALKGAGNTERAKTYAAWALDCNTSAARLEAQLPAVSERGQPRVRVVL